MTRHEEFEQLIRVYRERWRLLAVTDISFGVSCADFKEVCRSRLSTPQSVRFFWAPPNIATSTHAGYAMLGFETRDAMRAAQQQLGTTFNLRGRRVRIQRASRHAWRGNSTARTAPRPTAGPSTAATNTTLPAAVGPATAANDPPAAAVLLIAAANAHTAAANAPPAAVAAYTAAANALIAAASDPAAHAQALTAAGNALLVVADAFAASLRVARPMAATTHPPAASMTATSTTLVAEGQETPVAAVSPEAAVAGAMDEDLLVFSSDEEQ